MEQQEKARNATSLVITIVGILFAVGGFLFKEGFVAQPLIKYSILGIGVLMVLFGFTYRMQKVSPMD